MPRQPIVVVPAFLSEIARLRDQQRVIVGILRCGKLQDRLGVLNKERWIEILQASDLDREAMRRWHEEFERRTPDAHLEFLEMLGIPPDEIQRIRSQAQA